jgi:hypothetical protein
MPAGRLTLRSGRTSSERTPRGCAHTRSGESRARGGTQSGPATTHPAGPSPGGPAGRAGGHPRTYSRTNLDPLDVVGGLGMRHLQSKEAHVSHGVHVQGWCMGERGAHGAEAANGCVLASPTEPRPNSYGAEGITGDPLYNLQQWSTTPVAVQHVCGWLGQGWLQPRACGSHLSCARVISPVSRP